MFHFQTHEQRREVIDEDAFHLIKGNYAVQLIIHHILL